MKNNLPWNVLTYKLWKMSASRGFWSMPLPADRPRIKLDNAHRITSAGKLRLWSGRGPFLSSCFAFSPDSMVLAVGDSYKDVTLWEVATGRLLSILEGREVFKRPWIESVPLEVQSIAFSPDGKTLVVRSDDRTVSVWDVERGRELYMLTDLQDFWETAGPAHPHISPRGKILAALVSKGHRLKLWDLATGEELFSLARGSRRFALSPDGKLLATAAPLQLWEVETGRNLRVLSTHPSHHITFSPDGAILAAANQRSRARGGGMAQLWNVQLWNVATGQERFSLSLHILFNRMAFSPDGKILAVATHEAADSPGSLRLWEVATGQELNSLTGGDEAAWKSISFSPDGLLLARGGGRWLQLWEVATGQELYAPALRQKPYESELDVGLIQAIAFSPDGTLLAVEESITKGSGVTVYAVQ